MKIRQAKETDLARLLEFEQGIVQAERPFDASLREGEIHYYDLLELIRSSQAEVLVVESDDGIIGSGYAKILTAKPYQRFEKYAYLGFMYVAPAFRGRGVNQLIVDGLSRWARQQNIAELRLEVSYNEPAKKAYEKAGFIPNLLEMRLELPPIAKKEIRQEWILDRSPEEVWKYLTEPDFIASWLMPNDFKLMEGHAFQFRTSALPSLDLDGIFHCKVLEIVPLQKLAYSWKAGSGNGVFTLDTICEWTLRPDSKGTKLELRQAGFEEHNEDIFVGMTGGWLEKIQQMLYVIYNKK